MKVVAVALIPVLFVLFYVIPGAVLISNSTGPAKRFEDFALAILLSLTFAPLTLKLFSHALPGSDVLLMAAFVSIWALAVAGLRFYPETFKAWLPDFSPLPRADRTAWLASALLTVVAVVARLPIFEGFQSLVGDDDFNMAKLTSIAATGLPSLYARQPLYPFTYFDLDYVIPALWTRYTAGEIGVAAAWVIHVGVQTFVISLFQTRLIYAFSQSRITRLFGILAIHTATGFDLFFLSRVRDHLEAWISTLGWFDGFIQVSMPITLHLWVPQNMLGLAIVGLIYCQSIVVPKKSLVQAAYTAFLLAALFETSTFVFIGALPGLAIWKLYEILTCKQRLRLIRHAAATALLTICLVLPFLIDAYSKSSFMEFGLRSFEFLDSPLLQGLKYPITALVYLFLEIGILLPLLLWLLVRPHDWNRRSLFWIFVSVGLALPFVVQTRFTNDIAMRGIMPAQFAAAILGSHMLSIWEQRRRYFVRALVVLQLALSVMTAGTELYLRYARPNEPISRPARWIARNAPFESLVFYEHAAGSPSAVDRLDMNYGQRLTYVVDPHMIDYNFTSVDSSAWRCLPVEDIYNAMSLCSIEAQIPGRQSIFVRYFSQDPPLHSDQFTRVYAAEDGSIYSLSCPDSHNPTPTDPPIWFTGPFHQLRAVLEKVPRDHSVAASSHSLALWLQTETDVEQVLDLSPGPRKNQLDSQKQLPQQLALIDGAKRPVWFLLGAFSDTYSASEINEWDESLLAHLNQSYFVAAPAAGSSGWLPCRQRLVVALPPSDVALEIVQDDLMFGDAVSVSKLSISPEPHSPGDVVPIQLEWLKTSDEHLKFFFHFLDESGTKLAQSDPSAFDGGSGQLQRTRTAFYLPTDLPGGEYHIRFGVYRAADGQRLTLPSGEDSVSIPLTLRN